MLFKGYKSVLLNLALIFVLLSGVFSVFPARAGTQSTALSNIQPGEFNSALLDVAGALDATFDTDGRVTTDFSGNIDRGWFSLVQPDNKIIVIGHADNGTNVDFALVRYNSDGSPDPSFDLDGNVMTDFGGYEGARSGALQADGRIVLAGFASGPAGYTFALARYNPDGSLDTTFDSDGKVTTNFDTPYVYSGDDLANSVVVQPDGRIVAGGMSGGSVSYFVLARYNSDGSLDATFGDGGKVVTDFNGSGVTGGSLALQPDGKILLAGANRRFNNLDYDFALARYNSDGSLDGTFRNGGKVTTDFGLSEDFGRSIALQPDGRILVAGDTDGEGLGISYFAVARYDPDGWLDTTFDTDGTLVSDFGGNSVAGMALALQPDGRLILGGYTVDGINDANFALERRNPDGSLDPSFGTLGRVMTDFGSLDYDIAVSLAIQSDGKILAAGMTGGLAGNVDFALARYLGETTDFLPDLLVSSMRIELQNTACYTPFGNPLGVRVWVRNNGQVVGSFGVTVNGVEQTVDELGIGETKAVFFPGYSNPVTAVVDAANAIAESDETNNARTEMVAIPTAPLPCPTNTPAPTATPSYSYDPLYLSLANSQILGGVSAADEDILYFDGTSWSLFFDGSDVGVGSPDLFAFSIVGPNTILMSFGTNVTVDGITATPQDILLFDATSLGSNTAGTFSLYFDGSDVGFGDATNEKIDALASVPDGHLLISTTGNPSVPGVSGARDEDLLLFTSTTLGDTTSGSWSLYFDGSDAGLGETSGEDVDALDLMGGNLFLSTTDNFSVSGLSGADEDVFVCELTSTGETTACTYQTSLYFDGSTWGLEANDIDAFHLAATGPVPTAVPTKTPTPTGTATPTATAIATSTDESETFTFAPVADAYVNIESPTSNYGSSTILRADASPDLHSFLRFSVQGLSETVTKATLRVYANSSSSRGVTANRVYNISWSESTINYDNAPDVSSSLGSSGLFGANVWVEVDVTGYITGNGMYTLGLTTQSSTALSFASRESANAPQLIIETHSGPVPSTPTRTPTPTYTPTATSTTVPFPTPIVNGNTFTFVPAADTYVHYGTASTTSGIGDLRVDNSPVLNSYLRFGIQGLDGTVTQATLRLYVYNSSSLGYTVHRVDDNTWNEAHLHYLDAPTIGSALGSSGAYGANAWVEVDVTAYITGNGVYSLALTTNSSTALRLTGRELPNAPQLVIQTTP